jgi:organic hydroperoxide reductase OsmC/OhrA
MQLLASQGGPAVPDDAEVMATVRFGPRSEGGLGLEIALDITLPGVARGEAEALIEKAHQICAYSNATRNNVSVKLGLIEA